MHLFFLFIPQAQGWGASKVDKTDLEEVYPRPGSVKQVNFASHSGKLYDTSDILQDIQKMNFFGLCRIKMLTKNNKFIRL